MIEETQLNKIIDGRRYKK